MTENDIICVVEHFYKEAEIIAAKELIFAATAGKPTQRRGEDRVAKDIKDILQVFQNSDTQGVVLPQYVAYGQIALPPPSGFEMVTEALSSLRSDMTTMKTEISSFNRLKEEMQCLRREMQQIKVPSNRQEVQPSYANRLATGMPPPGPSSVGGGAGGLPPRTSLAADQNRGLLEGRSNGRPARRGSRMDHDGYSDPRYPRRRTQLIGKRTGNDNGFESAPRFAELYVGSCKPPATGNLKDLLTNWCTEKIQVNVLHIEKLETVNETSQSFKLKFSLDERDKCLDPNLWPKGIVIRKFFRARTSPTGNNLNNNNAGG